LLTRGRRTARRPIDSRYNLRCRSGAIPFVVLLSANKEAHVQYLLLIHDEESKFSTLTEKEYFDILSGYRALTADLKAQGVYVGSNRLALTATASTVRVRDGEEIVTDGPFAETKEQLGGYFLIDVETLDEALEWAARIPSARSGSVEVRPVEPVPVATGAGR
jgi:hypothetical protein